MVINHAGVHVSFQICAPGLFFLGGDIYSGVGFLGHMIVLFLVF